MNARRAMAVTRRIFRELRNDRRTIGMMFVAPVFAMFVFGTAFGGDVKDVRVIVVNGDEGYTLPGSNSTISLSERIASKLDRNVLKVETMDDAGAAVREVEDGKAYAAIIFPEGFTRDVFIKVQNGSYSGNTSVEFKVDKSNINIAGTIARSLNSAMLDAAKDMGRDPPITVRSEAVYGKDSKFMDFFVPGIMAFVVYLLTTLLTLISFVKERVSGTLDRLLATPLAEGEIVAGYAAAFGTVGLIQSAILLSVGILAFSITIVGNVGLAFMVVALLAVVSQSLGILLSSLAKRVEQAVLFLPFIVLPVFLLSGVFWPIEAIPYWLRPASYIVPTTYAIDACRSVMIRGWGIERIWPDIAALLLFALLFLGGAAASLKRRKG